MNTETIFGLASGLPVPDMEKAMQLFSAEFKKSTRKIIVLDDDPTGVQTVHDIYVYTNWEKESLLEGFSGENPLFYILTNSRSFTEEQARKVHKEIAENIAWAAQKTHADYLLISRGDSTLRGHYPLETQTLRETLENPSGIRFDGEIICPFFKEGGRITAQDVHYVVENGVPVPAGQTEFAKDKTFGFSSSNLREWVDEKTGGTYPSAETISISLEELRTFNFTSIESKLRSVEGFNKIIVNALDDADVQVFCTALYRVLPEKRFLFRSAASFVKAIGGISSKPLLRKEDFPDFSGATGGLIIAGSHTRKTTAQLLRLQQRQDVKTVEFNQHLVLESDAVVEEEIQRTLTLCDTLLAQGSLVCLCTRRERFDVNTGNKEDELRAAVKISDALTSIAARLTVRPRFIIAKGGITSSDTGTKGLSVRRAKVAGQIQPGIPVWICGNESKFPGLPYIIFPGNVGEEDTLRAIADELI